MDEYQGKYKGRECQPISQQARLERFINGCYQLNGFAYALPGCVIAVGMLVLTITANILELYELSMPIFRIFSVFTCISFAPMILNVGVEIHYFSYYKSHKKRVLQYIEEHPMCTFDEIVQNNISPKLYCITEEMMIRLRYYLQVAVFIDDQNKTFYRRATEEDWIRWDVYFEDEEEEQEQEEEEVDDFPAGDRDQ